MVRAALIALLLMPAAAHAQDAPAAAAPMWRTTRELGSTGEAVMIDPRFARGGLQVMGLLHVAAPGETASGKPFLYAMRTLAFDCWARTTTDRMTIYAPAPAGDGSDAKGWMEAAQGAAPRPMSPALAAVACDGKDAAVVADSLAGAVAKLQAMRAQAPDG